MARGISLFCFHMLDFILYYIIFFCKWGSVKMEIYASTAVVYCDQRKVQTENNCNYCTWIILSIFIVACIIFLVVKSTVWWEYFSKEMTTKPVRIRQVRHLVVLFSGVVYLVWRQYFLYFIVYYISLFCKRWVKTEIQAQYDMLVIKGQKSPLCVEGLGLFRFSVPPSRLVNVISD